MKVFKFHLSERRGISYDYSTLWYRVYHVRDLFHAAGKNWAKAENNQLSAPFCGDLYRKFRLLLVLHASSLENAIRGNNLVYLGGVLVPILLFVSIANLCRRQVNHVLLLFLVLFASVVIYYAFQVGLRTDLYSSFSPTFPGLCASVYGARYVDTGSFLFPAEKNFL